MGKLEKLDKLGVGSKVWVQGDREQWNLATVTSRKGDVLKVKDDSGKGSKMDLSDKKSPIYRANDRVVEDMTSLSHFHVPGILYNLRERSVKDEPYTFLGGSVLVAVNPLKRIPDPKNSLGNPGVVNTAHPYAIAETAFQQLAFSYSREPENQSIVVGGESGSGKTESSKYVLKHLVQRGGGGTEDLDQRLLDSNPILEAFGNAATKRNPNSSRFGKFMKLHFKKGKKGKDLAIYGASVQTYLLERSRVTSHSEGERGYHVFYQLTNGGGSKLTKKLHLDSSFKYLTPTQEEKNSGGGGKKKGKHKSMRLPDFGKEDKNNFKELCSALTTIGIGEDGDTSQKDLFSILAGLLHLGNIEFIENEKGDGDEAKVKNTDVLEIVSELLGIKPKKLSALFIERKVKTVGEEIIAKRDPESAKIALDAVVKAIYTGTFDWLVKRITASLSEKGDHEEYPFIGVLDIFGFETFQTNDFEQLLINYTNEALQNTFNQQVFEAEATLYEKEGLLVDSSDRQPPPDNYEAMVLLGGKQGSKTDIGILSILDAETNAPQASDDKLVSNLHRTYKKNKLFPSPHPKDIKHCFIVQHYAGSVKYTIGKFIEKNFDKLPDEISSVLQDSKHSILSEVFSGSGIENASKKMKKKNGTIAGKFKLQIQDLINTLEGTKASFIRCIKPNSRMKRDGGDTWFSDNYVMAQLLNLSIPQTAEVLQGGLPTRLPFDLLTDSYQSILPSEAIQAWQTLGQGDERLFVKALFAAFSIPSDTYKMGVTKVFFKAGMLEDLNEVLNSASSGTVDEVVVQKFRSSFARAIWRRGFAKARAYVKFSKLLNDIRDRHSAATVLQRIARRRREILEAQAELARLKEEKARREKEIAKAKAKEAKRKKKEEEARAAKAKSEQEKKAAELARIRAQQEEEEQREREREAEENEAREQERAQKYEEEQANAVRIENEEKEKAIEALGEHEYQEQVKRDKKIRFEVDDNDEVEQVAEQVENVKSRVKRELRASLANPMMVPDSSVIFEKVRYKHEVIASAAPNPFSCFGALFGSKKKEPVRANEDGDTWPVCAIIISGVKLRFYEDVDIDERGVTEGKNSLGEFLLTRETCQMRESEHNGDALVEFIVKNKQGKREKYMFKLDNMDSDSVNGNLIEAYNEALRIHDKELKLAKKFASGNLNEKGDSQEMQEYKDWLRDGLINQEEFDMLINQQVTNDTEYMQQDYALYGEEGMANYKVVCEDCGEIYYLVPNSDDNPSDCDNCGAPLPDPQELEESANAIRAYENQRLAAYDESSKERVDVDDDLAMAKGKDYTLLLSPPYVSKVQDGLDVEYNFVFDCQYIKKAVKNQKPKNQEQWELHTSWSRLKFLHKFLTNPSDGQESIPESKRDLIPSFPADVEKTKSKEDRANKRLNKVKEWVFELLKVSIRIDNFLDNPFVHKFFNLPINKEQLLNEILSAPVLNPSTLRDVENVVGELVAMREQGAEIDSVTESLIIEIREQLEATADLETLMTSFDNEIIALTDEEKLSLLLSAENLLSAVEGLT